GGDNSKAHSGLLKEIGLPGSAPEENNFGGLKKDEQVQPNGTVLDVEEVVLQFFPGVIEAGAVVAADLSPAGDAGAHGVAHVVVGDGAAELLDEAGALGPGADDAHAALQHVPELRHLIQ